MTDMSEGDVPGVDAAFAALLADPRSALRPPPPTMSLARFRQIADAPMLVATKPAIAHVGDLTINGPAGAMRLRLYRPDDRPDPLVVLFMHGGGFVVGSLDTHDAMCRALAVRSGAAIVSVDYRLAPETPYPGALDDCVAALRWIAGNAPSLGLAGDRLAICGDSAGGHLAIGTALRAAALGMRLLHLGVIYPVIDPSCDSASARGLAAGYLLTRECLQWFWGCYVGRDGDPTQPLLDLLRADLAGLPPLTMLTAQFDPLRDEGEAFAARARAAGVPVIARRYAGMVHGFASLPALTPLADRVIDDLASDLRLALATG